MNTVTQQMRKISRLLSEKSSTRTARDWKGRGILEGRSRLPLAGAARKRGEDNERVVAMAPPASALSDSLRPLRLPSSRSVVWLCPEAASARAPGQVLFVGWITSSFWPAKTQWKEVGSPTRKEYEQYRRYLKKKECLYRIFLWMKTLLSRKK